MNSDHRIERLQVKAASLSSERMGFYRIVKTLLSLPFRLAFRPLVEGEEHIPSEGGVLLVANHRSFFDSFFQALALRRPLHWMAKSELFKYPGLAWLLVRLGAFPVRRGASDAQAIKTALTLLNAGEAVAVFPEGTRVKSGLGKPHSGAERLAGEAQVPIVAMAIVGTERGVLRRSLWHQGERVRISIGPPIDAGQPAGQAWPEVEARVGLLEGRRKEALALGALSIGALAAVLKLRRR